MQSSKYHCFIVKLSCGSQPPVLDGKCRVLKFLLRDEDVFVEISVETRATIKGYDALSWEWGPADDPSEDLSFIRNKGELGDYAIIKLSEPKFAAGARMRSICIVIFLFQLTSFILTGMASANEASKWQ